MSERRIVGAMLKAYRTIYSISLDEICKIGGFSKSTITKLEATSRDLNNEKMSMKVCEKIAKCMGMKLSEFFSIAENIEQEKDAELNIVVYLELSKYLLKKEKSRTTLKE